MRFASQGILAIRCAAQDIDATWRVLEDSVGVHGSAVDLTLLWLHTKRGGARSLFAENSVTARVLRHGKRDE